MAKGQHYARSGYTGARRKRRSKLPLVIVAVLAVLAILAVLYFLVSSCNDTKGDVKQGQQIGRVGSTGNSVAYHLHVGLVSPDGVYLNPYDLFTQAGIGPIQGQEP